MMNSKAPKSVLIADDQEFVRELTVRMLQQLNYATRAVRNGKEAFLALKFIDGALILDQQMEGMTGLEILRAVRAGKTPLARDFPVLILTGNADMDVVTHASALDVTAILTKPVSKAQLGERLAYAAERQIDLKPPEAYAAIKVARAKPIADDYAEARALAPKAKQAAGASGAGKGPVRQMHYSLVQPGMTVAENLFAENGSLLLAAGTELSEDMIARLATKCAANPEIEYVSVTVPPRPPSS